MATESLSNASTGSYVFMLILGLVMALWPLAIITNFRGYREGHARRTLRGAERLKRLPPYRSWARSTETDRKFTTAMQFSVATVFLLAAAALVVIAAVRLAARLVEG